MLASVNQISEELILTIVNVIFSSFTGKERNNTENRKPGSDKYVECIKSNECIITTIHSLLTILIRVNIVFRKIYLLEAIFCQI